MCQVFIIITIAVWLPALAVTMVGLFNLIKLFPLPRIHISGMCDQVTRTEH